ncbi:MAG: response regulator [Nitrospirae bacterium]|uniref:response regulator n=1 Tax=Candidatus Magnetobacterium casense TaxID=1455061 RepID=UPI000695BC32|nr:response regulator [Candidatus Magnetobacterium casensis]MBF0336397.1 response regulator [Nitrospirota bacterium]
MSAKRVLIVEDEFVIANSIKTALTSMGYITTSVVSSGEESVEKAGIDKPDIVLMDIVLSGEMTGIEAARHIRDDLDIPVIFLTSHANEKLIEIAKQVEPFGYLLKPFHDGDLQTNIEIALYKHMMEAKLKQLNKELEKRIAVELEKTRQKEQLLIQQSKMAAMGEMIGLIAHQWKQPLTVLSLLVHTLKDAYKYNELNEEYINAMVDSSTGQILFMSNTVNDFMNFLKPSKTKVTFNVRDAIEELISMFIRIFKKNNIELQIKAHGDDILLTDGYPNEFKQVILNILSNSKDAIIAKRKTTDNIQGQITIGINNNDKRDNIIISIRDNGGGIAGDIISKVFDPYFTTKDTEGTGIGLYMSKAIIETNMGGNLTVSNTDDGAEFVIRLLVCGEPLIS